MGIHMIFEKGSKILFIGDSISDYERARPVGEGLFNAWGRSYVADVASLIGCMYIANQFLAAVGFER